MFYKLFFKSLRTEIDGHEPRLHSVLRNGEKLVEEGHEEGPEFRRLIEELLEKWERLKEAVEERKNRLTQSELVQQVNLFISIFVLIIISFRLICTFEDL